MSYLIPRNPYEWIGGDTNTTTSTTPFYRIQGETAMNLSNLTTMIRPAPITIPTERVLPEIEHPYLLRGLDENATVNYLIAYAHDYSGRLRNGSLDARTAYNYFLSHRSLNYLLGKDKWRVTSSTSEVVIRTTEDNRRVGARRVGEGSTEPVKQFIKGYVMPPAMITDQTIHLIGGEQEHLMAYMLYYAGSDPTHVNARMHYETLRQLAYDVAMCDGTLSLRCERRSTHVNITMHYVETIGALRHNRSESHSISLSDFTANPTETNRARDATTALIHEIFTPFGVKIEA